MLAAASSPQHASAITWSTTHPGHAPDGNPVAGQGLARLNSATTVRLRAMRPESSRGGVQTIGGTIVEQAATDKAATSAARRQLLPMPDPAK